MEKTFSRFLVIRVEILGLVFLLGLLAGLCSGCGDGTEMEATDAGRLPDSGTSTSVKLDSGTSTAPVPVYVGTVDPNHILPPTGTCEIPPASQIGITLPSPLTYQVATSNGLFCTSGEAYAGAKNIDFTKPPYVGLTCQELVADTPATIKALSGLMDTGTGCCEMVYKAPSGYVSTVGVNCNVPVSQLSVLCSISGTFMGFSCSWTPV